MMLQASPSSLADGEHGMLRTPVNRAHPAVEATASDSKEREDDADFEELTEEEVLQALMEGGVDAAQADELVRAIRARSAAHASAAPLGSAAHLAADTGFLDELASPFSAEGRSPTTPLAGDVAVLGGTHSTDGSGVGGAGGMAEGGEGEGGEEEGAGPDDGGVAGEEADAAEPEVPEKPLGYYCTSALPFDAGAYFTGPLEGEVCYWHPTDVPPREPVRALRDEMIISVSSGRAGSSIPELVSDDLTKYWQSDGVAPHTLTLQFYRRQTVAEIALYLDFSADESYTPQELVVKHGSLLSDLHDLRRIVVVEPCGWVRLSFVDPERRGLRRYLRTHVVQVTVQANHQAGRDCHIRGLKVFTPWADPRAPIPGPSMPLGAAAAATAADDEEAAEAAGAADAGAGIGRAGAAAAGAGASAGQARKSAGDFDSGLSGSGAGLFDTIR